jgi:salicylate hydroxylase
LLDLPQPCCGKLPGQDQPRLPGSAGAPALYKTHLKTTQAALAYERLRRERLAAVQRGARETGMRYDSSYADPGVRDTEITAHAAFRRRLYDHDVVPEALAVATSLT